ncbi:hypothetical protein PPIS_a3415 [Pseudoalteromonas piscicida]|uniref:Uncharacterized protein n=1 Tax=Pseudoalteromonas piscicida TaxID=43662 RepID=A0ABN5CHZ6_PSEO7|nr:hypothetical protein PPIS_a3415 [Pseudoalteromonas piscicida]
MFHLVVLLSVVIIAPALRALIQALIAFAIDNVFNLWLVM